MDKPKKEKKELSPIEKWARAQQMTEGITDAIGSVLLLIGITLVMIGMNEISVPAAQYEPILRPVLPFLADMDQQSAGLSQVYMGVASLLLAIIALLRTRVVRY